MIKENVSFERLMDYNKDPEFKKYFPDISQICNNSLQDDILRSIYNNADWVLCWDNDSIVGIVFHDIINNKTIPYIAEDEKYREKELLLNMK